MPRVKKPEPLSLSISPLHKDDSPKKDEKSKIGVVRRSKTRKMISLRMRPEMIDLMDIIIKKLKKKTKNKYSQSAVVEMALSLASTVTVEELLSSYGDTFKI
jgi:hypothetical protein